MKSIKDFDGLREWIWDEINSEREHITSRLQSKVHGMDEDFPFTDMEQARLVGYLEGLEHIDDKLRSILKYGGFDE